MPFSSTKYLWGQRGAIGRGTGVDPCSPLLQGPKSPQGWARSAPSHPPTLCQPLRGHFLFFSRKPSCRGGSLLGLPRPRGSSTTSQLSEPCGEGTGASPRGSPGGTGASLCPPGPTEPPARSPHLLHAAVLGGHGAVGARRGPPGRRGVLLVAAHGRGGPHRAPHPRSVAGGWRSQRGPHGPGRGTGCEEGAPGEGAAGGDAGSSPRPPPCLSFPGRRAAAPALPHLASGSLSLIHI